MYLSVAEYVGPFLTSGSLHIFFPWPVVSLGSAPWVHIFPQTSEFPRTSPKHALNLPAVRTLPIISLFGSSAPTHSAQGAIVSAALLLHWSMVREESAGA